MALKEEGSLTTVNVTNTVTDLPLLKVHPSSTEVVWVLLNPISILLNLEGFRDGIPFREGTKDIEGQRHFRYPLRSCTSYDH